MRMNLLRFYVNKLLFKITVISSRISYFSQGPFSYEVFCTERYTRLLLFNSLFLDLTTLEGFCIPIFVRDLTFTLHHNRCLVRTHKHTTLFLPLIHCVRELSILFFRPWRREHPKERLHIPHRDSYPSPLPLPLVGCMEDDEPPVTVHVREGPEHKPFSNGTLYMTLVLPPS